MSDIICRQCGQEYSRTDFPTGHFHCTWCNWKEMLPAGSGKKTAEGQRKSRKAAGKNAPAEDAAENVAVAEPNEVEMTPPVPKEAPDEAALRAEVEAEWSLVAQASPQDFQIWCGRLLTMFGFTINDPDNDAERDCDFELTRNGEVRFVDCRHFPDGDTVPRRELQKLAGAMVGRQVARGMIITSGTFDEGCRTFAANLPNLSLELIDGAELQQTLHAIMCGPLRKWWK